MTETNKWVLLAAKAAESKSPSESEVLYVGEILGITEWFLISTGRNVRQVRAIVEEVERQITEAGGPKPNRIEGLDTGTWVLVDYGDFIVHVFTDEGHRYYDLPRLWRDVPRLDLSA